MICAHWLQLVMAMASFPALVYFLGINFIINNNKVLTHALWGILGTSDMGFFVAFGFGNWKERISVTGDWKCLVFVCARDCGLFFSGGMSFESWQSEKGKTFFYKKLKLKLKNLTPAVLRRGKAVANPNHGKSQIDRRKFRLLHMVWCVEYSLEELI